MQNLWLKHLGLPLHACFAWKHQRCLNFSLNTFYSLAYDYICAAFQHYCLKGRYSHLVLPGFYFKSETMAEVFLRAREQLL